MPSIVRLAAVAALVFAGGVGALRTPRPQTVIVRDAHSKREVTLIGCMHYNPASINLAEQCVVETEGLGAVVVESCESRWRRTQEISPLGSPGRRLLPSEMMAAAAVAEERGVPLSLGDADVGELGPRLKELLVESLRDLLSPAGWKRIYDDLARGAALAFDTSDLDGDNLKLEDFLRPDILLGFLASAGRYPLAAFVKAPVQFGTFAAVVVAGGFALDQAALDADVAIAAGDTSPAIAALSAALIAIDVVFPIVAGRLLLVAFLEERNVRLARSITEAGERSRGNVVAVLGALHVNGVARLLKDPATYPAGKAGTWWSDDLMGSAPGSK